MTGVKRIFAILLYCLLLLTACDNPFHPKLRHLNNPQNQNRTPTELLQNLELAYRQKNIDLYKELLSPDFRFELISAEVNQIGIDFNNDGIKDSFWGYEQEVEFTDNLFNRGSTDGLYPPPDQIHLRLSIPPQELWEDDPTLGHETWVVIPCTFELSLLFNTISSSLSASGTARFYLKPQNNRWYIAIWRDESNL